MAATHGLVTQAVRALDTAGVTVSDISVRGASLDDVFLTLTGHKTTEQTAGETTEAREAP